MNEADAIQKYLKDSFAVLSHIDDFSASPGCSAWWKAYSVHADEMRARMDALRLQKTKAAGCHAS
jgi:hypothetical protein